MSLNILRALHAKAARIRPADVIAADANHMYLYGIISPDWGISASSVVTALNSMKGAVTVHINSDGGDVFEAVSITSAMAAYSSNKGKVSVMVDGVAASAAGFIALAGDTLPAMLETSMLMLHKPLTMAYGNANDLQGIIDLLNMVEKSSMLPYYRRSGKTDEQLQNILAAETWYSAEQAKAEGFASKVIPVAAPAATDKKRAQALAALYPNFPVAAFGNRTAEKTTGAAVARTLRLPETPVDKFRAE